MTIDLVLTNLNVEEHALVKQLETHVRKAHHRELAPFLFEQLQNGRACILDVHSAEFKGLTKWQ
jgi:hypothetical protein